MAAIESISEVRKVLEDQMLDLVTIVKTIDAAVVANDETASGPSWHFLFFSRILQLEQSLEAYTAAVHHHAYPVLKDLQSLTR